jgi:hypothetical protein
MSIFFIVIKPALHNEWVSTPPGQLHYLSAPVDVLFARIQQRGTEPPIQREDLVRWSDMFQPPDAEEMALFDRSFMVTA